MRAFGSPLKLPEYSATPTETPPAGEVLWYAKPDGIYKKDSAGVETKMAPAAGGELTWTALTHVFANKVATTGTSLYPFPAAIPVAAKFVWGVMSLNPILSGPLAQPMSIQIGAGGGNMWYRNKIGHGAQTINTSDPSVYFCEGLLPVDLRFMRTMVTSNTSDRAKFEMNVYTRGYYS